MNTILVVVALLCAAVAAVLSFQWFGTDGADAGGWLCLSFVAYFASLLARP